MTDRDSEWGGHVFGCTVHLHIRTNRTKKINEDKITFASSVTMCTAFVCIDLVNEKSTPWKRRRRRAKKHYN